MSNNYTTDKAQQIQQKAFYQYRNHIDQQYIKTLRPYFKAKKLLEIVNSTRTSYEKKLTNEQMNNLLNNYYKKGGENS